MPKEIYEVVAQGARYWFLFLMVLIVWRSWRWYRKDKRKARKRMKLLPDAGFVGEMVVIEGCEGMHPGDALPLPREGTLGTLRTNDLAIQGEGVARRHLWFRYEEDRGLLVEPFDKNPVTVDKEDFTSRKHPLYMAHGSCLYVGGAVLRLRLFMGFESTGYAQRREDDAFLQPPPQPEAAPQPMDEQQMAAYHQMWLQQQWLMQQQAYQQGYQQAMQAYEQALEEDEEDLYEEDELPFDMAQIAQQEGMVDHSMFMRPQGMAAPAAPSAPQPMPEPAPQEAFFAPEMADDDFDDGGWAPEDEDMTDAAVPPRSAYIGHDEAEAAKRRLWDHDLGGGNRR